MTAEPVADAAYARVHARLDETAHERRELLRELIRIESATGGERVIQDALAGRLRAHGLAVELLEVDVEAARSLAPAGLDAVSIGGPNLLATLPGSGGGRSLLLNGHCDTVPVGDAADWTVDPLGAEVRDGRVWGRGACDMKAGLAAAISAIAAVADAGVELRGDVALLSTVGEEAGCPGSLSFAASRPEYDAAIVAEPTRLAIAPAHGGFAHLRIALRGKGAHGSVRDAGVSAIEKLCELLAALRDLERRRGAAAGDPDGLYADVANPAPINVGVVRGGASSASVAEELTCSVRLGLLAGERFEAVQAAFEEHVAAWAAGDPWLRDHPPAIDWSGPRVPGAATPVDAPIVAAVQRCAAARGVDPTLRGVPFGSDMANLVAAGIPSLLFGPGDPADVHCVDESVSLREYDVVTHVLAETILGWCGT